MYLLDERFTLFESATSSGDSKEYVNTRAENITVQIEGDFSSASVEFLGKLNKDSEYQPIYLTINMNNGTVGNIATEPGVYVCDISGYKYFKLKLNSVSGSLSAYGRLTSI